MSVHRWLLPATAGWSRSLLHRGGSPSVGGPSGARRRWIHVREVEVDRNLVRTHQWISRSWSHRGRLQPISRGYDSSFHASHHNGLSSREETAIASSGRGGIRRIGCASNGRAGGGSSIESCRDGVTMRNNLALCWSRIRSAGVEGRRCQPTRLAWRGGRSSCGWRRYELHRSTRPMRGGLCREEGAD
jgi:hypothetical protein